MTSQTKGIRDDSAKKCPFYGITLFDVTHYLHIMDWWWRNNIFAWERSSIDAL
jgi:hypothetical protein